VQGGDDFWVSVAADGWPPGTDVIYVLVAIHVPDVSSSDAIEDDGLSADGFEGSNWGIDSTWH
jgi:hypothetical protein